MNHLETADDAVEVVLARTFDAPLALVWKVWTEVEHRNQWWGRPGFTTVCELDLRPGGKMSIHMRGPDETLLVSGTVEEVIANERLVTSGVLETNGVAVFNSRLDVSFAEHAGTTSVTVRHTYWNFTVDRDTMMSGASMGWTQGMERLEAYLRARV
jgi:uncharacterized protein YndB with AHSA1/START domain